MADTTPWYKSKAWKRYRRNVLGIIGTLLLLFFIGLAVSAPLITSPQIAQQYRGHTCARDLALPIETHDWTWYKRLGLPNAVFFDDLERIPRVRKGTEDPNYPQALATLRNPSEVYVWRLLLLPPASCLRIPRVGFSDIPVSPSREHIMGITSGGYDIFYGVVWGARLAFYVGLFVTAISLAIGLLVGGTAGFFGGWIDSVLMRFTDIIYAFPNLVLAIVFVTVFGAGLMNALTALALVGWTPYARLFRGEILRIRGSEFVDGARALGANNRRIFRRHVLPNVLGPLIVVASLDIGSVVLTNSALAFLGLGAEVGTSDWGQMASFARGYIKGAPGEPFKYWFISFWPGITIVMFVMAWNLLGDAYRDVFDPRDSK